MNENANEKKAQGDNNQTIEKLALELLKSDKKGKVTIIVGAGVSAEDNPDFSSKHLKEKFLNEYISSLGIDKKFFDEQAIAKFGRAEAHRCTLEELFSILETWPYVDEKSVFDFLDKWIRLPSRTSSENIFNESYDYLAHLLHHKVISYIFNGNHDEMLSVALDDEIGEGGYGYIVSRSEFDAYLEKTREGSVPEIPTVFKLHGTMSRPLTLRPTVETVKEFEDPKYHVLKRVLSNSSILIIIGYSFRDLDMRKVLRESVEESGTSLDKIYWIDSDITLHKNPVFVWLEKRQNLETFSIQKEAKEVLPILCESIHKKETTIPTIERHKIRTKLLSYTKKDAESLLKNQFLIEIIIYAVKIKGLFGLEGLIGCQRIKSYARKLEKRGMRSQELFHELIDKEILHSLDFMLSKLFLINEENNSVDNTLKSWMGKIIELLPVPPTDSDKDVIFDSFKRLVQEFDIDVGPFDYGLTLKFKSPKYLDHSFFLNQGNKIIKEAEELMIIAETGEWLFREFTDKIFREKLLGFKKKEKSLDKYLRIILCKKINKIPSTALAELIRKDVYKKFENAKVKEGESIRYLPWNKHIHHMVLNQEKGIYFGRYEKSSSVIPVLLDKADHGLLKEMFDNLWNIARPKSPK